MKAQARYGIPERRPGSRMLPAVTLLLLLLPLVQAQTPTVRLAVGEAEVLEVRGTVELVRRNQPVSAYSPLPEGSIVVEGDRIRSGPAGFARLGLVDGSSIELQPGTELEILDFSGGIRELFRIWLGKVRLKIRKLVGSPNPYEMHSPIATIGVRGTEFEIEVEPNAVTRVRVYEGLVAVRNDQVPAREVMVDRGKEVTVYPLRPPDPPVTFEQVVAENFTRDTPGEHSLIERFTAFPDPHLDLVENPAYAAFSVKPEGRFYIFPARSESFTSPEISPFSPLNQFADVRELFATDTRRLEGLTTRVSYLFPRNEWVFGGIYQYQGFSQDFEFRVSRRLRTALGGEVSVEQIGSSPYAPDISLESDSHRGLMLAARRYPGQAIAVSYDWSHTSGAMDTFYEFRPNGTPLSSERSLTRFGSDTRRLTFGYHREGDRLGSLGFFYKLGFVSGTGSQPFFEVNGEAAEPAGLSSSGYSHEIGSRWRKRIHSNLHFALTGSLQRTHLDESVDNFRIEASERDARLWLPRVGAGLGLTLWNRLFAGFDYQYSLLRFSSDRWDRLREDLLETSRQTRQNHALHAWGQYHLPFGFFMGGGMTSYWTRAEFSGLFYPDQFGRTTDAQGRLYADPLDDREQFGVHQPGIGVGWHRRDLFFVEYQVNQTRGPRFQPLGHSFLLRLAF